ncbi:MAG: OB-fold domain-containing protein [Rhodospirillales bacterium]|nr:OB-fold domain-containing protein [Rhodospirillales bacterium]MDE2576886.1 OB-fold domain-containing protein [Rhodospirillales bacterium]
MSSIQRKIPAPTPTPETEAFWAGMMEGRFQLRRCAACGEAHWYPRAICPHCMSDQTEWVASSGEGVIYSYSVMRRAAEPYAIAYVTLAEGVTMLTNLVACDFDTLAIGQRVKLVAMPTEGGPPVPCFTPA